jgi:hypothetical protein
LASPSASSGSVAAPVELPPSRAPLAADAYQFVGLRIAAQTPS